MTRSEQPRDANGRYSRTDRPQNGPPILHSIPKRNVHPRRPNAKAPSPKKPILLTEISEDEVEAWGALLDIFDKCKTGWTLIGGRMVQLHVIERGGTPTRVTVDLDAGLDVRQHPRIVAEFTALLSDIGFESAGVAPNGIQHRWVRGNVSIDVIGPTNLGERAQARKLTADGGRLLASHGIQQAVARTESVPVILGERTGSIRRPNYTGALVAKAAALKNVGDTATARHASDFSQLVSVLVDSDLHASWTQQDRKYLNNMIGYIRSKFGNLLLDENFHKRLVLLQRSLESH